MRILIVDDDQAIREMLARLIGMAGHKAASAEDGGEARLMLAALPFDLVVSDIDMPRTDGLTLLKAIRAGETAARADLPVVMASGEDHENTALNAGATAYLAKPFDPRDLLRLIEEAA